ncbi:MAG: hypothetical protein WD033_02365 [Nitrosopumilaceae archaeon]
MTLDSTLDKHCVDFAHNYTKIRVKCPECVRTIKGDNHVRVFKNLAGLWWHFKNEHGIITNSLFSTESVKEILRNIAKALDLGMFADAADCELNTTTSSSLLYDGRPPRSDVLIKLKEIADLLRIQSEIYPFFGTKLLLTLIKVKLGPVDERTMKKYFDCITSYSTKNIHDGTYDVTGFCAKLTHKTANEFIDKE